MSRSTIIGDGPERQATDAEIAAAASYPTKGGHAVRTETHEDSAIAWCTSNCGSTRTYWAHLTHNPGAAADGWASAHAETCTVSSPAGQRTDRDRPYGITAADLTHRLDQLDARAPAEVFDYDLNHALTGWHEATGTHLSGPHLVVAHLTLTTETGTREHPLSNLQTDRLTQMLNVDTAILTAHAAATRSS